MMRIDRTSVIPEKVEAPSRRRNAVLRFTRRKTSEGIDKSSSHDNVSGSYRRSSIWYFGLPFSTRLSLKHTPANTKPPGANGAHRTTLEVVKTVKDEKQPGYNITQKEKLGVSVIVPENEALEIIDASQKNARRQIVTGELRKENNRNCFWTFCCRGRTSQPLNTESRKKNWELPTDSRSARATQGY